MRSRKLRGELRPLACAALRTVKSTTVDSSGKASITFDRISLPLPRPSPAPCTATLFIPRFYPNPAIFSGATVCERSNFMVYTTDNISVNRTGNSFHSGRGGGGEGGVARNRVLLEWTADRPRVVYYRHPFNRCRRTDIRTYLPPPTRWLCYFCFRHPSDVASSGRLNTF